MNWRQLLESPPPAAAWDLDLADAVVVHRASPSEYHCAAEHIPTGSFEIGPVGIQAVDTKLLAEPLARLRGAAEGTTGAAVVVPSGWLRSFLLDGEQLPRREREVEDVVRWRLKKLLPVAPSELRLSIVRLPEVVGRRQILVLAGVERAIAAIEGCFKAIGVDVGLITTRLFPVAARVRVLQQEPSMLVHIEPAYLSIMVATAGVPRLLRTKPLPQGAETVAAILREMRLTLEFVRDRIGLGETIRVMTVCHQPQLEGELQAWLSTQAGLQRITGEPGVACGPSAVADRIGPARLGSALAVVTGAVR